MFHLLSYLPLIFRLIAGRIPYPPLKKLSVTMELGSRNVFLGASFHFILQQTWEFVKKQ
ncbi:MAG: hypothetical protein IPM47_09345 [Sphingobacteriales bacterium]|nr:MAG: hypothetical protein IPM47_09345 [Sphingobacteriales bacterium]